MKKLFIMAFAVTALFSSSVCVIRTESANINIREDAAEMAGQKSQEVGL